MILISVNIFLLTHIIIKIILNNYRKKMSENKTFEELFLSECKEQNLSLKNLKILLVSDIHKSLDYLEKLKEWQVANKQLFDYIFCTGDLLSLTYPNLEKNDVIAEAEADISSILSYLENMCLNVIYIGGNHDPKSLFDSNDTPTLTIKSINLHRKSLKLANDLYLVGLGGAVPTIESNLKVADKKFTLFSDISNKVTFPGYPYNDNHDNPDYAKSDNLYGDDLNGLFKHVSTTVGEANTTKGIKYILLTHNGPFYSTTSVGTFDGKCGYMGSKRLGEFLQQNNNDVFLNIHGHTHPGYGLVNFNKYSVVNPGALKAGNFAVLNLKRDSLDEWKIANVEFIKL
jgi:Icc-related predicted phosphoesterase